MRAFLRSKDFWKYILGKIPTLSKKKKADASNVIISHLGNIAFDAVVTLNNKEDPKLLWEAIVKRFASNSINNKACIWLKFMQYKYNNNLPKYLKYCHKMIKEILIVQLGIPDNIISILILAKLFKDFWNVVDNIMMNKSIIFFSIQMLLKLQELVFMKETQGIGSTSTSSSNSNNKEELHTLDGITCNKDDSK